MSKRRYVPAPQTEQTIALTEEQLHEIIRDEVAAAVLRLRTDLLQMMAEEIKRQTGMQAAAAQCRRPYR